MKIFVLIPLLLLVSSQAYADNKAGNAMDVITDSSKSNKQMSDEQYEEFKKHNSYEGLGKQYNERDKKRGYTYGDELRARQAAIKELYVEGIVAVYRNNLLKGMKKADSPETYLKKSFDANSRVFTRCVVATSVRAQSTQQTKYSKQSAELESHFRLLLRAYGKVVELPELENKIIKQFKDSYEDLRALFAKETMGETEEKKIKFREIMERCDKASLMLNKVSLQAKSELRDEAIETRSKEKLAALVKRRQAK